MTAQLQTEIRESSLADDFDPRAAINRAHSLAQDGRFLLFDGLTSRYSDPGFARASGLNLETGELFLGGVQFELPPARVLAGHWEGG